MAFYAKKKLKICWPKTIRVKILYRIWRHTYRKCTFKFKKRMLMLIQCKNCWFNANLINYFDFLHNTQDCLLVNMESVVGRHHRVVRVAVERIRPPPTILATRNPLHHSHNITITITTITTTNNTNTSSTLISISIRILILITILRIIFISIIIRRIICCALNRSHFWTRPALATH